MSYRYKTLTEAIKDKKSPLREYLERHFPNRRPLQMEYKRAAGPLLVPPGSTNPGTLGAAFDFYVRFTLDKTYKASIATAAELMLRHMMPVIREVISIAQQASSDGDREALYRAVWVCALTTEIGRNPSAMDGSPLSRLPRLEAVTPDQLLSLASSEAVRELDELATRADDSLLPIIEGPFHVGPKFDASLLCSADADLICGGLLLDLKTRVGGKNARGERYDALPMFDVFQILGYLLFDRSNRFQIDRIGWYSSRYEFLVTFDVDRVLEEMAGRSVDLFYERERVWELLGGSA